MDENIKIFIQELVKCEEIYEIKRWQLRVQTYLIEAFGDEMANKFQSLNIDDNPWDGSARQRGYLEALVAKKKSSNKNIQANQIAPKKLTYDLFIQELDRLITSGETLYNSDQRDLDPKFRRWRLEVTDLIDRINKEGYSVRCSIRGRSFGAHRIATKEYLEEEYNRELQDTLNELSLIKKRYDNFGEPKTTIVKKTKRRNWATFFLDMAVLCFGTAFIVF